MNFYAALLHFPILKRNKQLAAFSFSMIPFEKRIKYSFCIGLHTSQECSEMRFIKGILI